jgi:predicted kinase
MLHFICGKAASGKTTLARELAARYAAVLFGEDEWLTRLMRRSTVWPTMCVIQSG